VVITAVRIDSVTPRGGGDGTQVVVLGSGFGIVAGTVTLDPLGTYGSPFSATITLWQDDEINYMIPAGFSSLDRGDKFHLVYIAKPGNSDGRTHRWWLPAYNLALNIPPTAIGLDYQWPNLEEGTDDENQDNPLFFQAADFNRLLDNHLSLLQLVVDNAPDRKDACQAASIGAVAGSYDSVGGASGRGRYTGMPNSVDAVPLGAGFRVLLKNQLNKDENGIWEVLTPGSGADGVWERAPDFDTDTEVTSGAYTNIISGGANQGTGWLLITPDPITIGGPTGTGLDWIQFGSGSVISGVGEYPVLPADVSVGVRDWVRIDGFGVVQKASADTPSTVPAIGVVRAKPTNTTAIVKYAGTQDGFSGLTPGQFVFLNAVPGGYTQNPAVDLSGPQDVIQRLGLARTTTEILVLVDLSTINLP